MNNIQGTLVYQRQQMFHERLLQSKKGSVTYKKSLNSLFTTLISRQRAALRRIMHQSAPYEDAAFNNAYQTLIGFGLAVRVAHRGKLTHVALTELGFELCTSSMSKEQ